MPVKKDKSQHRKRLLVVYSGDYKTRVDIVLSRYKKRFRSKYLTDTLKKAIAQKKTDFVSGSYGLGNSGQFQISMPPEDYDLITSYCNENLPANKRSRWVVQRILELFIDK